MRLTCNPAADVAYLRLRPPGAEVETLRISDELNIDLAPDGSVHGIEFLNANDQLRGTAGDRLVVENLGREVPVPPAAE